MSETKQKLRFGVIGCGAMASDVHCPNLNFIPGASTVAYCDLDEERARKLLQAHGGDYTTTDYQKILADPDLDAVLIQTGPTQHAKLVQAAARTGKHVFVEKPIAVELADALETARVVEKSGIKFIYGTCNRLAPMVKRAKRMCPHPLYSYCQCAGTITHQACHNIDLAVNLFHEGALLRVYASGRQFWGLDPNLPADSFSAVLTFSDGSTHTYIQHGGSWNSVLKKYHYQLFGKECCMYLANRFKECHFMKTPEKVERSWRFEGSDWDRGPNGYMGHYEELEELVNCIRHGGNGSMTIHDAAYVLAVEKAILKSIESKQVVDFEEFLRGHDASWLIEARAKEKPCP